jgi:small nuclear ribonucleoprotein (snRNP)-like protein
MRFYRDRNSFRRHFPDQRPQEEEPANLPDPFVTGSEAAYFRSLIDSHTTVTVVLTTGERLRGHVRYYDRDCFSLGMDDGGANLFLRKDSVRCISEE